MNLDAILPRVVPSKEVKTALNRTISTAVSSPRSSPSEASSSTPSPAETARAACLISSNLQAWRFSKTEIPRLIVDPEHRNSLRPLEVFKRGRFGECLVVVSGLAVSLGHLEADWEKASGWVDIAPPDGTQISQDEMYEKLVSAACLTLGCCEGSLSYLDVLAAVGKKDQTDMAVVLSGALLLDRLRV